MTPVEVALIVFVIVTAVAAALLRDVLASVIVFAGYSLGMAILYAFYRAPDVALTEAAIGVGVTTLLLLLTLAKTTRPAAQRPFESINWPAAVATAGLAIVMIATLPAIPGVGDRTSPAWSNAEVTQYYIANTYADLGVENAVMAVLAAYRGFDTFGEAVVVFVAVVAAMIVLDQGELV